MAEETLNGLKADGVIFTKDRDGKTIRVETRREVGERFAFGYIEIEELSTWLKSDST